MKRSIILLFLLPLSLTVFSQPMNLVSICDSVISKNFNVRVARLEKDIAGFNNTAGRAGALPILSLNGLQQGSVMATRQEFFNGDIREANNAVNMNTTISARLDWMLFQGFAIRGRREQLQALQEMGEVTAQQKIETELFQAASVYYEILWRNERIKTLEDANRLSRLRQSLAENRLRLGSGSRLEVLQSNSDLNADSSELLKEINEVQNLTRRLLVLIGTAPDGNLEIDSLTSESATIDYATLFSQAMNQNRTLMLRKAELSRSMGAQRTAKSTYYPSIGLFSEYNFLQSSNQVGILKSNRSLGPSFGISFRYFIFDGLNGRQDVKIARAEVNIAQLSIEQARLDLQSALLTAYSDLELQKNLVKLEKASLELAADNLSIATKQLNIGVITDLQFREVQQLYTAAEARLANARFLARMAELSLHYLSGDILQYLKG